MSPRNQDDTNCKSDHFLGESDSSQSLDFTPNILHKKHRVIQLVKAQLLHLHGLFDSINSTAASTERGPRRCVDFTLDVENDEDTEESMARMAVHPDLYGMESQSNEPTSPLLWLLWIVLLLTAMFIMVLLAAWLSAGPLSNRAPHTPIHWSSLVKTDGICELEKKYLLRWSTSNHLE